MTVTPPELISTWEGEIENSVKTGLSKSASELFVTLKVTFWIPSGESPTLSLKEFLSSSTLKSPDGTLVGSIKAVAS